MKLEKITKIILILQIVIYIIAMLIVYTTKDANDLSGIEAIVPLFLFDILIPVIFLLVIIHLIKKLTKRSRPSWKILCLFGVVIILGVFNQQIYTFVSGNSEASENKSQAQEDCDPQKYYCEVTPGNSHRSDQ